MACLTGSAQGDVNWRDATLLVLQTETLNASSVIHKCASPRDVVIRDSPLCT